jgi:ectoine hydroxylase-related dioxygenase (phytanoyl-CoA dioxygenase family)
MPLNTHPLRAISQDDIDTYARDGVVCLRNVFDPDWLKSIEGPARELLIDKRDFGLLPSNPGRYMARTMPDFRRFVFESPVAEAAARVMQSSEVRFFFDEIFAKKPQSDEKTIWHNDRMGWPVTGTMVPSLWIPLVPIVKANSLEVIAGTQTYDTRHWLFSPNAKQMIKPDDRPWHPDCEPLRDDPAYAWRFMTWDMAVGDMLVVHPWSLHYSHGNPTDAWRIAVSVRVFGDDIRWAPRPDCVNLAGVSWDELVPGDKPDGDLFPLLWSADGRRDDDSAYPRGFATRWQKARNDEVNPYAAFMAASAEKAGVVPQAA